MVLMVNWMKHYRDKYIEAHTVKEEYLTTCDLCGEKIEGLKSGDSEEVTIEHNISHGYIEGGYGRKTEIDMCGNCFKCTLIPFLNSQGVNVHYRDYDW